MENNLNLFLLEVWYNRSINVIKLNCHISANKLYIVSASDNKLVMTINGEENVFYPSEKEAIKADFIKRII